MTHLQPDNRAVHTHFLVLAWSCTVRDYAYFARSRRGAAQYRIRVLPLFSNRVVFVLLISDDEDERELVSDNHDIKCPETELHLYLECGKTKDALRFWENNKLVFPRLFAITRKIFCVTGTTACVERLFSIAGFVLSNRRLSLTDANFHNHIFAHCNLDLLLAISPSGNLTINKAYC